MTPLLLLPGMMCDARLFAPQTEAFSHERAITVPRLTDADTIERLAGLVLDEAPDRFALAGLSMGGIVAMEMARQAPDRIAKLALIDTNPRAELPEVKARRGPQMEMARAGKLCAVMRDEMKPNYLAESPHKPAILDLCMEMAMSLGPEIFVRQSLALRDRPDQRDTLRGIAVPTLVMCGREDRLCPVERHELMHDLIPGSRLEIIDGAAHLPTLEQPQATNAALARWLEE